MFSNASLAPTLPLSPQMEETYYFHLHGVDNFIWRSLPPALRGASVPHGDMPAILKGGLEIDFLGHKLRRRPTLQTPQQPLKVKLPAGVTVKPPSTPMPTPQGSASGPGGASGSGVGAGPSGSRTGGTPRPPSGGRGGEPSGGQTPWTPAPGGAAGLGAGLGPGGDGVNGGCDVEECSLRQLLRVACDSGVQPFWLAARWTPKGMRPEDPQPTEAEILAASGRAVASGDEPAGLLEHVHKDFLMCLLFYPFKDL